MCCIGVKSRPRVRLTARHKRVLELRRSGVSLRAAGRKLGLSAEGVRQIEAQAKATLGEPGSVADEHRQMRADAFERMRDRQQATAGGLVVRLIFARDGFHKGESFGKLGPARTAEDRRSDELARQADRLLAAAGCA